MVDIVESMRAVCGNPKAHRESIDYALIFGMDEIQRLRAEVERLTTENTGLQSDLERACQLINAALDDYRGAVATTMERAAQIVDDMPARSNYAIYDAIAAAIRAEASKEGGDT